MINGSFTDSLRHLGFMNTIDDMSQLHTPRDKENVNSLNCISFKNKQSNGKVQNNFDIRKTMELWNNLV
jgi:hypothetical protein